MKVSYYIIDDLRLGYDPKGVSGWQMSRFLSLDRALEYYRVLSPAAVKAFGLTDGVHVLELVRCQPLSPDETDGENVLVSDYRTVPLWADVPEAATAEDSCISILNLRYQVDGTKLIPLPPAKGLSKRFKDKFLCLDKPGDYDSAIRWIHVAGQGWIAPSRLEHVVLKKGCSFCFPLVLKYLVDSVTLTGELNMIEVTPWEYQQLKLRTEKRIKENKRRNAL